MQTIHNLTAYRAEDYIIERRLLIKINGQIGPKQIYDSNTTNLGQFYFDRNANIDLTLIDYNDVGKIAYTKSYNFVSSKNEDFHFS